MCKMNSNKYKITLNIHKIDYKLDYGLEYENTKLGSRPLFLVRLRSKSRAITSQIIGLKP